MEKVTKRRKAAADFPLPKSVCSCGHTGDGPLSAHHNDLEFGHGGCLRRGCDCERFVFSGWTTEFQRVLDAI